MNCDNIADYRVKITYKGTAEASGVIVKLREFPNNFFVFTAKHTFGENIEKDEVSILYTENKIDFKSYIALSLDIVVFIFDNSALENIQNIKKVNISLNEKDFKDAVFSGYPNNVDGAYCEKCEYHEKITTEENLYRISPKQNTDSYFKKGLENSKGYSGSGLFINNENSYELVGIIKEHESSKSAFHYIALAPLKEEISTKLTDSLCNQLSIPQHLINEIKNNNVVLFVGSEFSSNFGFPTKEEFIDEILNQVDEKFSFIRMGIESGGMTNDMALNLLKLESEIIKKTIATLYSTTPPNKHFIKTLWKFTTDIVTTNYDTFLEDGIKDIKIISSDNNYEIPKNRNFRKLFKLHGGVNSIDNVLIFEDEYKKLYSKREMKSIQNYFRDKTCLFIGFSTDEVYFDWMYQAISCKKKNYIISTAQKDFTNYGFEPIVIENYHQLSKAFNEALVEEPEIVIASNAKDIVNVEVDEVQKDKLVKPKVCIYTASPLNSNIDYSDKLGVILNTFKKYSVKVDYKVLNEDELLDSLDYDYNFIFTKTNQEKIIMEDEYFIQKSIDLDELEEIIEVSNTFLFLDEEIENSNYSITSIKDDNKIKRVLTSFLHKNNFFEKGKSKYYVNSTDLPELIDRKNLNNFVGRVTDLENLIKKILTIKDENKILTIKGSGGIGKTTIISKAVVEIADRGKFKEGIKFVPCEFIKDYDDFENKITYAFDMNNAIEFQKQLKEQELDDDRLIILDNIETLLHVDDTEQIKDLIRMVSDYATIVITSRELLNERDYEDIYEIHKLTTDEAEELFKKLSKIIKYNKKLLRVDILENLLDNNPLAIELVTKNKGKSLVIETLKKELEDEDGLFDIATIEEIFDKESDLNIERTKSLFQSINYSYQKLTDKEKLALETLSLFPDGLHIENLKNFYNQKISNDKKNKKTIEHKIHNFSDREIRTLEEKSLVLINNGFVILQSIIGRFAEFRFNQRDEDEKLYYFQRAYAYNSFLMKIVSIGELKQLRKVRIFDYNRNNFIKSLDYISIIKNANNKKNLVQYIDRMTIRFSFYSSPNKRIIQKLKIVDIDTEYNRYIESSIISIEYYYGDFNRMFKKIQNNFPLNKIKKEEIVNNSSLLNSLIKIFHIYAYEGHPYEYIDFLIKNNSSSTIIFISYLLGEYIFSEQLLNRIEYEKGFDYFELLLNKNELEIKELEIYIKGLYKTEFIERTQSLYTLIKANEKKVEYKDIKKLVVVNPFTDGLKSLMFAIKDESGNTRKLYEDAIEKLYHIRYYHVEAILIYSQYLKDTDNDDYLDKWFKKGKELADKHHYRYLLHQFNCLDSGIYTDYDENNYPLPEPLDYSGIIKKYGLDV